MCGKKIPGGYLLGDAPAATSSCANSGIAQVDFRSLGLTFLQLFEPRRQYAHQEGTSQNIEVATGGFFVDPQRTGKVGPIPNLSVVVGDHGPEPPEHHGGNG